MTTRNSWWRARIAGTYMEQVVIKGVFVAVNLLSSCSLRTPWLHSSEELSLRLLSSRAWFWLHPLVSRSVEMRSVDNRVIVEVLLFKLAPRVKIRNYFITWGLCAVVSVWENRIFVLKITVNFFSKSILCDKVWQFPFISHLASRLLWQDLGLTLRFRSYFVSIEKSYRFLRNWSIIWRRMKFWVSFFVHF